jgi:uncharacterized protein (DUF427 family)
MKAIWNDTVVAEAPKEELIYIEGNWYFPPSRIKKEYFRESDTPYSCPWKGDCQYYDVGKGASSSQDSAFAYLNPKASAIEQVKKDFSGYVAFWRDISVSE